MPPDDILPLIMGIQSELASFNATIVGLTHDIENAEEKVQDLKKTKADMWAQINNLKADINEMKVKMGGSAVKGDLLWKILTALAIAAASAALLGG